MRPASPLSPAAEGSHPRDPSLAPRMLHQTQVKDAPVTSGSSQEQEGTCP